MTPAEKDLRHRLAFELARYFLLHLREELKKPANVSDYITIEGVSFRKITEDMIESLNRQFPELEKSEQPKLNIFRKWWSERDRTFFQNPTSDYDGTTFKNSNQAFLFKILDIKYRNPEFRKKFEENMQKTSSTMRAQGRPFGIEVIFSGESEMFLILYDLIKETDLPVEECHKILYEQNFFMFKTGYHVVDSELKDSFKKTDEILKSILPENIADEIRNKGRVEPKLLSSVSIMFCDLVGFTDISSKLSPKELLAELDECYTHFDKLVRINRLEKIKTIGDSYMCASGLFDNSFLHAVDAILCGLKIQEFMRKYQKSQSRKERPSWKVRIGINTGPVVGGIIGTHRFNYDIWGDAVNISQRMESSGESDRVNVSADTMELGMSFFSFEPRGKIHVKGKGELEMYFVTGVKPELSVDGNGRTPNRKFLAKYKETVGKNRN
ncbi:MAG: adenylate/guanylate cyclase domain-containing protein [Leptospira sp.]|nr:adenylate/guanylate cyclase domain-containing protein [Leptospira sp.]